MFDDVDDVSVSLTLPDELVVFNHASVSTLRSITGEIVRSGTREHQFHFDIDVPPGGRKTVKIDDFMLREGDTPRVVDADFSWSM
jgi:hypothetical protein